MERFITKFIAGAYQSVLKPVLFKFDPEWVHEQFVVYGRFLGKFKITRGITRWAFNYSDFSEFF